MRILSLLLWVLTLPGLSIGASVAQTSLKGAEIEGVALTRKASLGQEQNALPLEVRLKTDRRAFKLKEKITIEVLLINRSKAPLYLYGALDWGESASLSIWLKDSVSGKDIPQEFIPDALSPPPTSKEAFIKILPNHVYGVVFTCPLAELNVRRRGTYELVAEYHSPVPSSMSFGLPIWSREDGPVVSDRVTITVGD